MARLSARVPPTQQQLRGAAAAAGGSSSGIGGSSRTHNGGGEAAAAVLADPNTTSLGGTYEYAVYVHRNRIARMRRCACMCEWVGQKGPGGACVERRAVGWVALRGVAWAVCVQLRWGGVMGGSRGRMVRPVSRTYPAAPRRDSENLTTRPRSPPLATATANCHRRTSRPGRPPAGPSRRCWQ